jgi:PAS domain S-box-containing protein
MNTTRTVERAAARAAAPAARRAGRDALLEAVVFAADRFLRSPDWSTELPEVLARLGESAGASRAYVFENDSDRAAGVRSSQRFEWTAPGWESQQDNPAMQALCLHEAGLTRWAEVLAAGGIVRGRTASFPASEHALLASQDVLSLVVVPIFADGEWWGFIGFDDCGREREWRDAEVGALRTAAGLFGAAVERTRSLRRLEESEARFHTLTRATLEGVLIHDGERVLDVNPSVLSLLGCRAEEIIGRSPFEFLSPESRRAAMRRARTGDVSPYEVVGLRHDGSRFAAELKGGTITYAGRPARCVSIRDLTHRKAAEESGRRLLAEQAARAAAQGAESRARFLAEASRVLSSSFDSDTTLARIARLAVPYLADYCVIDVLRGGQLRRLATAAADPGREALVEQLAAFVPEREWSDNPIIEAIDRVTPVLLAEADRVPAERVARSAEHRAVLRRLAPRSAMFVPILAGGRVSGVISFVATGDTRRFTSDDLAFAQELAGRTGLALQNAELFEQAQEAVRSRDEVLAVVAHDLRNPLGVVRNAAELLAELGIDDRQRRFTGMILRAAGGMNRLIDDLLQVTRLEAGHLQLDLRAVRAGPLIEECAEMLRPLAAARGLELCVRVDAADASLLVDSQRIHQVLSNLVGNAIKFTPSGGCVTIGCSVLEAAAHFSVVDTGPGIPPEELPHVFRRFWQSSIHDQRGVGLGLSIARGLVDAHGGRIWVESPPGGGAHFRFTIPLGDPAPAGDPG